MKKEKVFRFFIICLLLFVIAFAISFLAGAFYKDIIEDLNYLIGLNSVAGIIVAVFRDHLDIELNMLAGIYMVDVILVFIVAGIVMLFYKGKRVGKGLVLLLFLVLSLGAIGLINSEGTVSIQKMNFVELGESERVDLEVLEDEQAIDMLDVTIIIPPYFGYEDGELKITEIVDGYDDGLNFIGYSVTLDYEDEYIHDLNNYVEIVVDPDLDEDELVIEYYDEDEEAWLPVAWYIDEERDDIVMLTNHFTNFRLFERVFKEDGFMEELAMPVIMYSPQKGYYVEGANPMRFTLDDLKRGVSTMDYALNSISGSHKTLKIPIEILKTAKDVPPAAYQFTIDSVNSLLRSEFAQKIGFAKDTQIWESFNGKNISAGISKVATVLAYIDYVGDSFTYFNEMNQGKYSEAALTSYRAGIEAGLLHPALGPYGIIMGGTFKFLDMMVQEYDYWSEDDTRTAFYSYYNSNESGVKNHKYWYDRFDVLMNEEGIDPLDLGAGIEVLNAEMDVYLNLFWTDEYEEIRSKYGAYGITSVEQHQAIVETYKHDANLYELQKSIIDHYVMKMEKGLGEQYYLMLKSYYDDVLNRIMTITVELEDYDYENCSVTLVVDGEEIYEESFDREGVFEFAARFHTLMPTDEEGKKEIIIYTSLEDEHGVKILKEESYYLPELPEDIFLEYSNDVDFGVSILDRDVEMTLEESYKFEYEYTANGSDVRIPNSVAWSTSSGMITDEGVYTPEEAGVHKITLTVIYDEENVTITDDVKVNVLGENVADEPNEEPADEPSENPVEDNQGTYRVNFAVIDPAYGSNIQRFHITIPELNLDRAVDLNAEAFELELIFDKDYTITVKAEGYKPKTQIINIRPYEQTTPKTITFADLESE